MSGGGIAGEAVTVTGVPFEVPSASGAVPAVGDAAAVTVVEESGGSFLATGGETGRLIEAYDWSATELGPLAGWSPTLRTAVSIMLESRHPMLVWWGPDFTVLYNDAFIPFAGQKHPVGLGQAGREMFAEVWPTIGPMLGGVLDSGEATWVDDQLLVMNRRGFDEHTYWTYSYSPIRADDGRVLGVFTATTDTTGRVLGERRLGLLGELAHLSTEAHSVAEVMGGAAQVFERHPADVAFALLYEVRGCGAELVASAGVDGEPAEQLCRIDWGGPGAEAPADGASPFHGATRSGEFVVVALDAGVVPTPSAAVRQAAVASLRSRSGDRPLGTLVLGLAPTVLCDDDHVGFLRLAAGHVETAVHAARAHEEEQDRVEALAQLDRAKSEFFSNVSHEFRTPLTLIAGPVEDSLADDLEPLAAGQRARLETVRRNTGRLRRLVNNMLDFARLEGGHLAAETVATDIGALTAQIAASFAPAVERAGLGFDVDCPGIDRAVHVDPDMWEKIVLNLVSNALKFTLDGEIGVRLAGGPDHVEFVVRDTGVGIPPDEVPRLFQRFHRVAAPAARSHEGTGIGLALVHELVRLHDGTVSVESHEGHGTTVRVRVPYGLAPTGPAGRQRESAVQLYLDEAMSWSPPGAREEGAGMPRKGPTGRTGSATVLVVDDNGDLRSYLAGLLRPYWEVVVAEDGEAALTAVAQAQPDLVLTDVMMPRLDGFGLLRALRADPATKGIPVVFLSARAGEESAIEGLDSGADDYLVKPFSSLELVARVRANLELARLRNHESTWRTALVEALSDGVSISDADGTVVEVNGAFGDILGYGQDDAPYRAPYPWWPDAATDPEARSRVEELHAVSSERGRGRVTVPLRHRDGHRVWVDVAFNSLWDADGERRMFVATLRDVTADVLAADRAEALGRLTAALTHTAGAGEVLTAGLAELRAVWKARRALAVVWDTRDEPLVTADPPSGNGDVLDDRTRRLLEDVRRGRGPYLHTGVGGRVTGMGCPVDSGNPLTCVWLELDPPRLLGVDDRSLFGVLCGYLGQALRRARLFDEQRTVATTLQRSILGPQTLPDGVAVRYEPAVQPLEVGGDWYDVVDLPGGRLGLVVGDCVGRGLAAASVMGQLRSACRAVLLLDRRPAEVLSALDAFAERIPGASCTTVFCAVVDTASGSLRYSSAGHLPAAVAHPDGTIEVLDGASYVPLATLPGPDRPEASAKLGPGSVFLSCTDGLVERRSEGLDIGLARLRQALIDGRALDPETLADHLLRRLLPGEGHEDDVAVVVYRQGVAGRRSFDTSLPAEPSQLASLRRELRHWLADSPLDVTEMASVLVACGEACTNAMEHAAAFAPHERVRVSASFEGATLEVCVEDRGPWKPPESGGDRGRGLQIMHGLMDEVAIDATDQGTTVRMTKRCSDAP